MTTHYMAKIEGVTVTHSTAGRAYSHVLVGFVNVAKARLACEKGAKESYASNVRSLTKEAGGQTHYLKWSTDEKMLTMFTYDLSPEAKAAKVAERKAEYLREHAERVTKAQAELATALELGEAGYIAHALAEFDARRAKANNTTEDGTHYVCDLGWSIRLDLAQTNYKKHSGPGYHFARLEILEAVQTEKRAKPSKSKATR